MPINLGNINFGIAPDLTRLQTAIQQTLRFGQTVQQVAGQTGAGSAAITAAYLRQERAITSALQATLRYQQAAARIGGVAGIRISQEATASFERLNQQMMRGQLTAIQYQRAMEQLSADMGRVGRAVRAANQSIADERARRELNLLTRAANALGQTSILINGPLGGVASRLSVIASIANKGNIAMVGLLGGFAVGVYAFTKIGTAAIEAQKKMQNVVRSLQAVSGSGVQTGRDLVYLEDIAKRTGTSFASLATEYTQLKAASQGTNLEGQNTEKIFTAIAFAGSKLSLSAEDMDGTFRAVQQMMSKGTVQAEELRGQLGDRLPGAFRIAAQAMGVTTMELGKMMKAGTVLSDDFLPKFADALIKAFNIDTAGTVNGIVQSQNNMTTALFNLSLEMDKQIGFSSLYNQFLDGLADRFDAIAASAREAGPQIRDALSGLNSWFDKMAVYVATGGKYWPSDATIQHYETKGDRMPIGGHGEFSQSTVAQRFTDKSYFEEMYPKKAAGSPGKGMTQRQTTGLREATKDIRDLNAQYEILAGGPSAHATKAMRDFKNELEITDAVESYRKKLEGIKISTDQVTKLTGDYETALRKVKAAELIDAETITRFEFLADVIGNALTNSVDAFTSALENGTNVMDAMKGVARSTVSAILNQFMKLAFINPLMNSLFGQNNPVLGAGFGLASSLLQNVVVPGSGGMYHGGGIAGSATRFKPLIIAHGGLSPDEYPAILQQGERVLNRHESAQYGSGKDLHVHISLDGANGDKAIQELAFKAALAAVQIASRDMNGRILSSVRDGRKRGKV